MKKNSVISIFLLHKASWHFWIQCNLNTCTPYHVNPCVYIHNMHSWTLCRTMFIHTSPSFTVAKQGCYQNIIQLHNFLWFRTFTLCLQKIVWNARKAIYLHKMGLMQALLQLNHIQFLYSLHSLYWCYRHTIWYHVQITYTDKSTHCYQNSVNYMYWWP